MGAFDPVGLLDVDGFAVVTIPKEAVCRFFDVLDGCFPVGTIPDKAVCRFFDVLDGWFPVGTIPDKAVCRFFDVLDGWFPVGTIPEKAVFCFFINGRPYCRDNTRFFVLYYILSAI